MARQIILPLDWQRPGLSDEIFVTPANRTAVDAVALWQNWPHGTAILVGAPRSGKSLLAGRFREISGGTVIEDADRLEDDTLFHAWNRARGEGAPLLLTSALEPAAWQVVLPDLRSRLGAALLIEIGRPDTELMVLLIQKFLGRRGTGIDGEALAYAERRLERSYAAAERFALAADDAALAEGRSITLAIVKPIVAEQGELGL